MISELDRVKIIKTGITGTVVDIFDRKGNRVYAVESDDPFPPEKGYGKKWPIFDCLENDLIRL